MKRLFSSIKVGNLELKNRIVIPAMHLGYAEDGFVNDQMIRFYQERARGGTGLIVVGGAYVHRLGIGGINFLSIDVERDGKAKFFVTSAVEYYLSPGEMKLLLRDTGFEIESFSCDYEGTPFEDNALKRDLVICARIAK